MNDKNEGEDLHTKMLDGDQADIIEDIYLSKNATIDAM